MPPRSPCCTPLTRPQLRAQVSGRCVSRRSKRASPAHTPSAAPHAPERRCTGAGCTHRPPHWALGRENSCPWRGGTRGDGVTRCGRAARTGRGWHHRAPRLWPAGGPCTHPQTWRERQTRGNTRRALHGAVLTRVLFRYLYQGNQDNVSAESKPWALSQLTNSTGGSDCAGHTAPWA